MVKAGPPRSGAGGEAGAAAAPGPEPVRAEACGRRARALSCSPVSHFLFRSSLGTRAAPGVVRRGRRPGRELAAALLAMLLAAGCAGRVPGAGIPTPGSEKAMDRVEPGWTQEGVASWYGVPFHGRPTASGEIYDMERMTAAHRTLPLGTPVRVTILSTGRSTEVVVNDRGPYAENRILDLSRAAARTLGILQQGTARVRIEVVERPPDCYEVQIGAFSRRENAEATRSGLEAEGEPVRLTEGPDELVRVVAGPYPRAGEAESVMERHGGYVRECR